jgi:phage terminase small subunit
MAAENEVITMDGLTPKQEKFVQGLFKGLSQREAYRRAYDAANMKDESIDRLACELAKNVKVASRLKELQTKVADKNIVTVERLVTQLAKEAFSDIKDFVTFGSDGVVLKPSDAVDGTLIAEVSETRDGIKFKRVDPLKAQELLGRYLGIFTDKVEHSGGLNITIDVVDDE